MSFASAISDEPFLFVLNSLDSSGQVCNMGNGTTGTAYPLANLGLFVPFSVPLRTLVREGYVSIGATSGNFDIGVYNEGGTRLTSAGATASGSTSPTNTTTMTDLLLDPETTYYMAFSASSNTITPVAGTNVAGLYEAQGVLEATSAYPLPSTVTYAKTTRAYLPVFGLNLCTTGF